MQFTVQPRSSSSAGQKLSLTPSAGSLLVLTHLLSAKPCLSAEIALLTLWYFLSINTGESNHIRPQLLLR